MPPAPAPPLSDMADKRDTAHFVIYRKRDDGTVEFMCAPMEGFWESEAFIFDGLDDVSDAYERHLANCGMDSDETLYASRILGSSKRDVKCETLRGLLNSVGKKNRGGG